MSNTKIVITEKDLREQVRDLCRLFGWKMYFSWTSIHSPRGFPDLVLVHPSKNRVIFAELKSEKGKLTEEQVEWLDALGKCGQEVYVWRPSNWEEIVSVLQNDTTENKQNKEALCTVSKTGS